MTFTWMKETFCFPTFFNGIFLAQFLVWLIQGPIHTAKKTFENGVFTPKTHQMFRNTPEKFENETIVSDYFGFVFVENSGEEESHDYRDVIVIYICI